MAKKFFERKGTDNYATPVNDNDDALNIGDELVINNQEDLSKIVTFDKGGCVYKIFLEGSPDIYKYAICVIAQGPKGFNSGYGHLEFTDATGDVYKLKIYDSDRELHRVRYNSKDGRIVKVEWHS